MIPGRHNASEENICSLSRTSSGKSYAISLPIATICESGWQERQKLELTVDAKRKRIVISDWRGK